MNESGIGPEMQETIEVSMDRRTDDRLVCAYASLRQEASHKLGVTQRCVDLDSRRVEDAMRREPIDIRLNQRWRAIIDT